MAGWSTPGLQTRLRFFQRHCDPTGMESWLDIGCGAGTYCQWLRNYGCQTVVGLDYSLPSLLRAKQFYPQHICWVNGSALSLPFADASFSGMICFGVSQVLHNIDELISEMYRVSKPGAKIWIDGLNLECVPHRWEISRRKRQGLSRHLNYTRPQQLVAVLEQNKFQVQANHWLPMAPSRLPKAQVVLERSYVDWLFRKSDSIARLFCHSYVIQAERPQT
ncbi:MAG TPA: SAM-dependent methyltransferase [Gammaproteobacteria bacterium]|nr:SAM-dependent methyltransferase [Gammaproteobacteria bacterium]